MKIILLILSIFITTLSADFATGKKIYEKKCSSCHIDFVPPAKLKENFFENKNKLLNMTIPSTNMLVYSMLESSKHIGDKNDPEMQKMELESYLGDYLYEPDRENSICDVYILNFYEEKKSMKGVVSEEEIIQLVDYFYGYKKNRKKNAPKHDVHKLQDSTDMSAIIQRAKKENKLLMIEATSEHCWFCKKMHREVLSDEEVLDEMDKNYIFIEVDIEKQKLPFNLQKEFKGMTPTFFVVTPEGKLISNTPGSWIKMDFLVMLKENLGKQ